MLFGVLPLVPLAANGFNHWQHILQTLWSVGKRNRAGNFRHQDGGLKKLRAEISGITTIFPIQMTLNNVYKFLMTDLERHQKMTRFQRKQHIDVKNLIVDETTQLQAMPF